MTTLLLIPLLIALPVAIFRILGQQLMEAALVFAAAAVVQLILWGAWLVATGVQS